MIVCHVANLGLIPGTPYGLLDAEPEVSHEHHWMWPKKQRNQTKRWRKQNLTVRLNPTVSFPVWGSWENTAKSAGLDPQSSPIL